MNKDVLKSAGFTECESELYLILLSYGQMSAYQLAEKAGLYRQVTYDTLSRLQEKGFVSRVKDGKAQQYKAVSPEIILEYLNEKAEQFSHLVPELKKLGAAHKDALSVETYKGQGIVRLAIRDIINVLKKSGGEVLCTANDESIPWVKQKTLCDQYERDLLRYKIKERVIICEGKEGIFLKGTSTYRTVAKRFFNQNPTMIYGNTVQIIIWGNPDYLIIIRSNDVAESYKKQFELLWSVARKK